MQAARSITGLMLSQSCRSCHWNPRHRRWKQRQQKDGMQSLPAVTFSSQLFFFFLKKKKEKNLICFSSKRKSQVADSPGLWALAPHRSSHVHSFVALEQKKREEKSKWILTSFCRRRRGERKNLNSQKSSTSSYSLSNSIRLHYIYCLSTDTQWPVRELQVVRVRPSPRHRSPGHT